MLLDVPDPVPDVYKNKNDIYVKLRYLLFFQLTLRTDTIQAI